MSDADPMEEEAASEEPKIYDWSAHYDDEGRLFYYNSVTEESAWDPPEEGYNPAPEQPETAKEGDAAVEETEGSTQEKESSGDWSLYTDDEGREYYYNAVSGETQWEKPEGFVAAAETEEPASEDPDALPEPTALSDEEPGTPSGTPPYEEPPESIGEEDSAEGQQEEEPQETEEPAEPEEEEIDPAIKKAQDAEAALNQPDSVLEPGCLANVSEVVNSEGGNPQKAISALIENYHGQTAVCGLVGRWLADLRASSTTASKSTAAEEGPSQANADQVRGVAQDVITRMAKERFSKDTGDRILDLSKSAAAFLGEMMDSPRWRKLLIDLSASHKDSAVLIYCLRAISKRGHHREIARRVNQSDHFAVFNAMLSSELGVLGVLAISAGSDAGGSVSLEELVSDLQRACSSTSYTYLYSIEMLRALELKATDMWKKSGSDRFRRAIRKWQALAQSLESAMVDPLASNSVAGSSPLFRKRRLDVALTISELHQRQRRRKLTENGDHDSDRLAALETALLAFLRRHSIGIQIDDTVLDPMLPSGLDLDSSGDIGRLLIEHPLAVQALLVCLFKPGTGRLTAPILKNKCARLVAFSVMAAEKAALEEQEEDGEDSSEAVRSDEVALTRMILQGSQLCEQLESMVSFLVTAPNASSPNASQSPGQKLCAIAQKCAPVAEGVILWARDFTHGPEFSASASFPTLSVSILSLVRLVCLRFPFTRRTAIEMALHFLKHSNADISYQKVSSIKEQTLRLLLFLLVKGEVTGVLGGLTARLNQNASELDASLVRYFVGGILEVIRPPFSIVFVRSFGAMLKAPKCVDAVKSTYFVDPHKSRLGKILEAFQEVKTSAGKPLEGDDAALVSWLLATYNSA